MNNIIEKNNDKLNYKVPTMFGIFNVDIEKFEGKILIKVEGLSISKEFSFDQKILKKEILEFLSWIG